MRSRFIVMIAAAGMAASVLAGPVWAQRGGGGGGRGGGRGNAEPPPPAPRSADGKILWGGPEGEPWVWSSFNGLGSLSAPPDEAAEQAGGGRGGRGGGGGGGGLTYDEVPLQDWAIALYEDRQTHELEPHARCKASGITRQFQTPYGVEIVEVDYLKRIYIYDNGGPHTFRTIYLDGRDHPREITDPSGYGHSIGWYEGDTLVVDTVGFDETFWLDRRGIPHTDQLHTVERFTRTDMNTIRYEVTFDDPGALKEPWTGSFNIGFMAGDELFEYICQQANYAHELMIGDQESVDRTATIIP